MRRCECAEALRSREQELVAREAEKSALAAEMESLASQMEALALDFQILADEVPAAVFRCDVSGVVSFHNARWTELIEGREDIARLHDIVASHHHARLDEHLLGPICRGGLGARNCITRSRRH